MTQPALPYGPHTPVIRQFLVRLAGLGREDRARAVEAYTAQVDTPAYQRAEAALATVMERSGRAEARDALSGPFLQLVGVHPSPAVGAPTPPHGGESELEALDPVAEPALAALMALLVRDLLPADAFALLTAPMAIVLDLDPPPRAS